MAETLVRMAICFLAGSIPFAVICLAGTGVDITKVGSGNPGFNNVLRVSKGRAILTLIGDVGKGILAVWLLARPGDGPYTGWLYGGAAVLGHCYSPFLKFNGGKGIATSAGVMLFLYPIWAAASGLFFLVLRLLGARLQWREAGAVASLSSWALFSLILLFAAGWQHAALAAVMTLFVTWRHKKNLQSLRAPAPSIP